MTLIICMFCNELKESSLEHIIPKSLGNLNLVTKLVCKSCNDKLGSKIDAPFVNNPIIKQNRQLLKLPGHSGKVPTGFRGGYDTDGNKIHLDRNFKPSFVPKIEETKGGFSILANSKKEAIKMGLKKLNRIGGTEKDIENFLKKIEQTQIIETKPKIKFTYEFSLNDFYFMAMKIAYEYAYTILGRDYYDDPVAKLIREDLSQVIKGEEPTHFEGLLQMLPQGISKNYDYLNFDYHLVLLQADEDQLYVYLELFNGAYTFYIVVSKQSKEYEKKFAQSLIRI